MYKIQKSPVLECVFALQKAGNAKSNGIKLFLIEQRVLLTAQEIVTNFYNDRGGIMSRTKREENLNIQINSLGPKYEFICDNNGFCNPVGQGGSGIVYIANQIFSDNTTVLKKRAIKFFIFRDDLVETWGYVSTDNFDIEIKNITRFNHQNILKVIDGDYYTVNINGESIRIPYTVTEYIDGPNLEDLFNPEYLPLCKKCLADEESIFSLFFQIVNGIDYLHRNNFFHCDIAPKNIFFKADTSNNFLAVIGDLGAGRTLKSGTFEKAKVIGTKEYMPDNVKAIKNKEISYDDFSKLQPCWDIYSTILTLKNVISKIKNSGVFSFDCWNLDRLYEKLCDNQYNSIEEIAKDIYTLRPSSNQILRLDELSEASKNIGQVLIPINSAYLSRRMQNLSKHDMLLRLMDVPQLLEGATTFPGANHTRYEHSLGTYELMRRAMLALLRNKEYAKFLSDRYVIIGLLSSLLSSIINFPYSYAISELQLQENNLYRELSPEIIFDTLINKKSIVTNQSMSDCINKLFSEYKTSNVELKYVIFGKRARTRNQELDVLHALLNSSIGVRVIDYMMRDSHHIGLTYKIDTEDLFKSMSISKGEFCLRQSGITSAEQIISNRYWLFKRIYWSDPNRAYAALLKYLFYTIHRDKFASELLDGLHTATKKDIQEYILKYAPDDKKKSVEHALLLMNQKGQTRYKSILVLDKNSEHPHANEICSHFSRICYSEQYEIRCKIEQAFIDEYKIPESIIHNGPLVLVDMPYEKSGNKLGDDIRVLRYDNSYLELSKASGIVSGLKTAFDDQLMLLRVFLRPDIYTQLIEDRRIGRNHIEHFLSEQLYALI